MTKSSIRAIVVAMVGRCWHGVACAPVATIAAHELRRVLLSPLAWVLLGLAQLTTALQFLNSVESFMLNQPRFAAFENPPGVSDWVVASTFADTAFILLMVAPLMTMRAVSGERRDKTLQLLLSAPVSTTEIVLGKYLSVLCFLGAMVGMICLMPLSLILGTDLDTGKLFAGALGLFLMLAAFAAAGLFISCLTNSPTIAAAGSFFLLFTLWLMFWMSGGGRELAVVVEYISMLNHLVPMLRGTVATDDVAYFVLFAAAFLALAIRKLDAEQRP